MNCSCDLSCLMVGDMTSDERDIEAIAGLRRQMETAENQGDPEPIVDALAEDAVLMVPTFPVSEGRDQCAAFVRNLLAGLWEFFERHITYVSDEIAMMGDAAIDRGHFSFTIRPRTGGETNDEHGKYLFLSRKDSDGRWRIARVMVTLDERDERRGLLRHFLAALAYRTQKALRDAPETFGDFRIGAGTRTPSELVRHMTSVLGYAHTRFHGGRYAPDPLPTLGAEVARFHEVLDRLSRDLASEAELSEDISIEQLLQGPFADAMTHAGQLAMLRRLAGSPIAPESFITADIRIDRLGVDQPEPAEPDALWPEAPPGWKPSER